MQATRLALPDGKGVNLARVVSWQDHPASNGYGASLTLTYDCGAIETGPPGSFVPYTETYTGAAREALLCVLEDRAQPGTRKESSLHPTTTPFYTWVDWLGKDAAQIVLMTLMQCVEQGCDVVHLRTLVAQWHHNATTALRHKLEQVDGSLDVFAVFFPSNNDLETPGEAPSRP